MGIGVGGAIPLGFTLISEYIPARLRARVEILMGMLAISGGYIISALSAFFFIPYEGRYLGPVPLGWRTLFLVSALTAIPAVVARFAIPEGPHFQGPSGRVPAGVTKA
jgi:putative MFS transporter